MSDIFRGRDVEIPSTLSPERAQGSRSGFNFGIMIVRIKTLDKTLPAQGIHVFQHFCGKFLRMVGHQVSLDFVGTSPFDVAEWASSLRHVNVPQVSFELLNPFKVFVAICTETSCHVGHCIGSPIVCEALYTEMPFSSVALGLGYDISVQSN
jgi:hypothetical protein